MTTITPTATTQTASRTGQAATPFVAKPIFAKPRPRHEQLLIGAFTVLPMLALIAAVPLAWGWGLSPLDVGLAAGFYLVSAMGVTVGFHRYFTHRAFKANRGLRIGLAVAGSLALQGDVITWVADHRRHHAFTDKEGDPHSPVAVRHAPRPRWPVASCTPIWAGCSTATAPTPRGSPPTCSPTATSSGSAGCSRCWTVISLAAPALLGGLITHVLVGRADRVLLGGTRAGRRPAPRHLVDQLDLPHDRRAALQPTQGQRHQLLAAGDPVDGRVLAQPAPRRPHLRPPRRAAAAQIDITARVIWVFEKLGWAHDVRWPTPRRIARLTSSA